MKQFKLFSAIAFAAGILFSACNNGDSKTSATDSTSKDTTTAAAPAATAKEQVMYVLTAQHKVKNYAKWKAVYDSHDSVRLSFGLHNYVIGRGVEDSSIVFVALRADDTTKARQFMADKNVKATMEKAGVVGAPSLSLNEMHRLVTDTVSTRNIVRIKVKDFDAWKKVFDTDKQARMNAGLTERAYGHSLDDKTMVSVVFNVSDPAKAKAFGNTKELKDKMTEAGVEGKPDIFAYHVVQQY